MFRDGVMGQNIKRLLTFALLFGQKVTLIKTCQVIYQIGCLPPGIPEMKVLHDTSLMVQIMKSPISM